MASKHDPIALEWAPNPWVADLWVDMLKNAGIPAFTEGTNLVDENAFAQKLLGALGQTVYVRREDLESARAVLADARDNARRASSDAAGQVDPEKADAGDAEANAGP